MSHLTEGRDYYVNAEGLLVFTSFYHLKRKQCCGSGCLHCPYSYEKVPDPARERLLKTRPPVILMKAPNKDQL